MKYPLLIAMCSASLLCVVVQAAEEPLTLAEAVTLAASRSPQVQSKDAEREAAQSMTISAGRLPDPELVAGVDNLPINGPEAGSLTDDFMTMRKIGVMQTFPGHAKRELRSQRASDGEALARAEQVRTTLDVKRQVAQAWIATRIAEDILSQLRELQSNFELQSQLAEAGVKSGRMTAAEAMAPKAALLNFRDRVRVAELSARKARLELARWLPDLADRTLAASPSFSQIRKAELLNSIHHHATLVTYDAQLNAARTDIALAEADKHPDWSVGLVYAKRGPEFTDMVSVEFRVGLPLFARNRQNPQIAAKRSELRKLESEREAELRMHTAEISQMVAEWETLVVRTNSFDTELLPLAKERVNLATRALQANRGDAKAVLDAQLAYVELQLQALELNGELGKIWVSLEYLQEQRSGT